MYKATTLLPSGGSKFSVGQHEACTLESVEKGSDYIDFNYRKDSVADNKRIGIPTLEKVYVRENETDQQALERSRKEALAHVSKHMQIFLPKQEFETFQAPDFDSFVDRAVGLLNKYKDTAKVNLQLIPDSDLKYATFGNFPNYIEKYVEGQPCTLSFSAGEERERVNPWKLKQSTSDTSNEKKSELGNII